MKMLEINEKRYSESPKSDFFGGPGPGPVRLASPGGTRSLRLGLISRRPD
jgi:hypothetical protein